MRKYIKYFIVFIFMLFLLPINSKAKTSIPTYGINGITISEDMMTVSGWAYITFVDFCNSDNPTYNNYEMKDESGNSVGIASRCSGKGFDSVQYKLFLHPNNGNSKNIYAVKKDGTGGNLRRVGISATCVNYWKPTVNGKAENCDGALSTFGEFPSDPINYYRRNYNVQYVMNRYAEGTYFYDDIGFIGVFYMDDLEEGVTYTLYLDLTINGKNEEIPLAAPGLTVSVDGKLVTQSKTSDKITVKSDYDNFVLNYTPDVGKINQDAGSVYYKKGSGFAQFTKSLGGGYFTAYEDYTIKSILLNHNASIVGNHERIGGFDFYNLGTTGSFIDDYTIPGNNYTYYAISPWVEISGRLQLSKSKINQLCGGTIEGSTARKNYCSASSKPADYDTCCICGGTIYGTLERSTYCSGNPNDTSCCSPSGGANCPIITEDNISSINAKEYTYWDSSKGEFSTSSIYNRNNDVISNYPKYCSEEDSTSTLFTDNLPSGLNDNVFCYQVGGFSTTSSNLSTSNYILTYSGGSYNLNVQYKTQLVCVSLDSRKITKITYANNDGNCVGSSNSDPDVKFSNETLPSYEDGEFTYTTKCSKSVPNANDPNGGSHIETYDCDEKANYKDYTVAQLRYGNRGMFNITDVSNKFEIAPTITLTDSTELSSSVKFNTEINTDYESGYSNGNKNYELQYNNTKMKEYLDNIKSTDTSFINPLNNITYSTFTQYVRASKTIENYESGTTSKCEYSCYNSGVGCEHASDNYDACMEKEKNNIAETLSYASDYFYGTLDVYIEEDDNSNCRESAGLTWFCGRYKYSYSGTVYKNMYVTIKSSYKEQYINMTANYSLPVSTISDRFSSVDSKWVSQVNLSDYYQISVTSSNYGVNTGSKFGVAETWNMDKALCALDVTDHSCNSGEATCACKYDKNSSLEKGVYYADCLDFRVVSVSALFPGKGSSLCVNPTSNCRQPGRNWLYVSNDFKKTDNFDYVEDKPMYHITLTPSTMNKITNTYKEYYTDIDLGSWYNPSKCTYSGNSRCSSDYESYILNELGSSVFTRNYDIINARYRALKNMVGVNEYKTSKGNEEVD